MTPDQITGDLHEGDVYVTQEEAKRVALVLKVRHRWLWRGLALWIVAFSLITFYALHQNRTNSAKVHSLQKTNCNLKTFLLQARQTRLDTASAENGDAKKNDLAAARGYVVLAQQLTEVGSCHPKIQRAKH